jgi:predicted PurR-regulated permease PerM
MSKMNHLNTTNKLLLVIIIPFIFYLAHLLSFILIPLISSMFIALLFLPLMRWMEKRSFPKFLSVIVVVVLIILMLFISLELLKLTSREIRTADSSIIESAKIKILGLIKAVEAYIGIQLIQDDQTLKDLINKENIVKNIGITAKYFGSVLSMVLTTVFFVILWLAESINFHKLFNTFLIKTNFTSVKTFRKIEKDLVTFIIVKFLMSLFTGVGTGLFCLAFDVSFPIFWGLFAFLINFIQMIGSFVTVICCSIFAIVEMDPSSTLLFFIICITLVQVLFGAILEPVFMGKSFSINVITILIMLMFWGFIWGIPGLIMSIPITVFFKIILEQFPPTVKFAKILE